MHASLAYIFVSVCILFVLLFWGFQGVGRTGIILASIVGVAVGGCDWTGQTRGEGGEKGRVASG